MAGTIMYASYFALFLHFFWKRYGARKKSGAMKLD